MKYNNELVEILKNKNFKTFWHCIDYLLLAGYNNMDVFGITLKEFSESDMFTKVAFIYAQRNPMTIEGFDFNGRHATRPVESNNLYKLRIGIIDETNIHLTSFYELYRNNLYKKVFTKASKEIEKTTEILEVPNISEFILDYINLVHSKFFDIDLTILEPSGGIYRAPLEYGIGI